MCKAQTQLWKNASYSRWGCRRYGSLGQRELPYVRVLHRCRRAQAPGVTAGCADVATLHVQRGSVVSSSLVVTNPPEDET